VSIEIRLIPHLESNEIVTKDMQTLTDCGEIKWGGVEKWNAWPRYEKCKKGREEVLMLTKVPAGASQSRYLGHEVEQMWSVIQCRYVCGIEDVRFVLGRHRVVGKA
jgi:hypothetical protein